MPAPIDTLHSWLAVIGGPPLGTDGLSQLTSGAVSVSLEVELDGESLTFNSVLHPVPTPHRQVFYRAALMLNADLARLAGAVISLDYRCNDLILSQRLLLAPITTQSLNQCYRQFVANAAYCTQQLDALHGRLTAVAEICRTTAGQGV